MGRQRRNFFQRELVEFANRLKIIQFDSCCERNHMAVVGFKTTPSKLLVPETSPLDRLAHYPRRTDMDVASQRANLIVVAIKYLQSTSHSYDMLWQRWDSNPRHRNDWCLKPAP